MNSSVLLFILIIRVAHGSYAASQDQLGNEAKDDFEAFVKRKEFVDKSLFIEKILKSPPKVLITAPSGWGKSTNLIMLKKFLELQVDEAGHTVSWATRKRQFVNDTDNYSLFMGSSMKIMQHKRLLGRHFGKYPIIHVDFKCKHKIRNSEYSVMCFREVIHNTISQHKYLCNSEKLTLKEKRFVEKWSDVNGQYEELYGQDVTKALHKLAILLDKQFSSRRIFVLIDNYEHPSSDAMFGVKDGKELNRVMKFNLNIISTVLNPDNKYQCKAVILGRSYITAAGIYKFEDTHIYRFLGNHTMQKYFGLSKHEVEELFLDSVPKLSEKEISFFHAFYGGFVSLTGDYVYSLNSVLSFLQTRMIKINTRKDDRFVRNLKVFCKINFMRRKIEALARDNVIEMDSKEVFTINDLINIRDILVKEKSEERIPENILFNFLLEQGYLTYVQERVSHESSMWVCKLPNLEAQYVVGLKLKKYYDEIYLPDKALLNKCLNFFKSVSPSLSTNPTQFKRALYWFFTTFEKLIKFRWTRFDAKYIYRILFSVIYHLDYKNLKESFVAVSGTSNQFNSLLVGKKIIFVIGLRVNDTSQSALENAEKSFTSYYSLIPLLKVKKTIYMGLGVNSNLLLSVSCSSKGTANDSRNEFHLP